MAKYRFFMRESPEASEWVAEGFDIEADMIVFHVVSEQDGPARGDRRVPGIH
jgi:hypothetical protein